MKTNTKVLKKAKTLLGILGVAILCMACGKKNQEVETQISLPEDEVLQEENQEVEVTDEVPIDEAQESKEQNGTGRKVGENLISNGDFSQGIGKWGTYTNGGECEIKVNDAGQLEVLITNIGQLDYANQVSLDEFALEKGGKYKMSYDIFASNDRTVEWRIQLNGGDYHPYVSEVLSLSSEVLHFEKEFEMTEETDLAPRLCFNLGVVPGTDASLGGHQVYLDNISLVLVDDSNIEESQVTSEVADIVVNQVGYEEKENKVAVIRGDDIGEKFSIVDASSNNVVFEGNITNKIYNESSKENTGIIDFSSLTTPGIYQVQCDNGKESYEFRIGNDVYQNLSIDLVRMLYLQRCGMDLEEKYATEFAHSACHTKQGKIYGTNEMIDVSGGWHDAGDYGKYVVPAAKTVADILLTYERNPQKYQGGKVSLNIPESGNKVPDILNETRYELEWLLKMQANNGGVYHKVTTAQFPGEIMPEDDGDDLVVAPISNCATADFGAVLAMAARIYADYDKEFSNTCLVAAKKALSYVENNSNNGGFHNPGDIGTGEYGDGSDEDEKFWLLCELYKTSKESVYEEKLTKVNISSITQGLGWDQMGAYGCYAYLTSNGKNQNLYNEMKNSLIAKADQLVESAKKDGYGSTMGEIYHWGSNMAIANNGILLSFASEISNNPQYTEVARRQKDYLLGVNATGYCFVTGYGTLSPNQTHHRPSQFLRKTMTGMLVGGVNCNLEDPYAQAALQGVPNAKCYVDNSQSYSCNEVTIYWNSALFHLLEIMH